MLLNKKANSTCIYSMIMILAGGITVSIAGIKCGPFIIWGLEVEKSNLRRRHKHFKIEHRQTFCDANYGTLFFAQNPTLQKYTRPN